MNGARTQPLRPVQLLRGITFLVTLPLITAFICLVALADLKLTGKSASDAQSYPRFWARLLLKIVGVKVEIEGSEHLDPEATYVFAGNHASQFDIYSFQAFFPHDFRWIAKKELFAIPLMGTAMKAVNFIPIDRSRGREALKSLALAAKQIADGNSVLIFPEGTRSPDGVLRPFKAGAFVLAIKSGVPVVPLGFNNTNAILPKGHLLPRSGRIVIRVGEPVPVDGYTTADKQRLARLVHDRVALLLDPHHLPRHRCDESV